MADKLAASVEREGIRLMVLCKTHSQKNKLKCGIFF